MRSLYKTAITVIAVLIFTLLSCASEPDPVNIEDPVSEDIISEPEESEAEADDSQNQSQETEATVEETESTEPEETQTESVTVESETDQTSEQSTDEEANFTVSEEVFTETFANIEELIVELNAIIREEDYDKWLSYLTPEYKEHFSSAEVLKEHSDRPLLKKYNIKLRSLNDYFIYVVVPSRSNARLDDLVFLDNERVKAIMIIENQRSILYQLENRENYWLIGL